jgi:hypothetical protein
MLFKNDIYRDFVPLPESITGWGGKNPIFETLINQVKPSLIVEIGSWKGQSAITMAETCQKLQLDSTIVCIDTWLGSEEHFLRYPKALLRKHGYPSLYYQFLSNVVNRELHNMIVPLPTTSIIGARILRRFKLYADLIYIDGSHRYADVVADITAFIPLLSKNGILFGHDYRRWTSVCRAVRHFCRRNGFSHSVQSDFWILKKNKSDD